MGCQPSLPPGSALPPRFMSNFSAICFLPPLCLTYLFPLHDLENQAKVRLIFWPSLHKEFRSKIFIPGKKVHVCVGLGEALEKKENACML